MANEQEPQPKCEHKFVHLETVRHNKYMDYSTFFVRVDRFFCERCLYEQEKRREEYSRDVPEWYRTGSITVS